MAADDFLGELAWAGYLTWALEAGMLNENDDIAAEKEAFMRGINEGEPDE